MATSEQFIGRREGIGIGVEATVGTAVTAGTWLRWLSQDFQNKAEVIENESALGVVDAINDSEVVAQWSEGTIGGKVTETGVGYLMVGFFGLPSTGAAVGGIYPHTFTMGQSSIGKTLTIIRNNILAPQAHAGGVVDRLSFEAEAGGWVTVEAAVKARVGASTSPTVAFTTEAEFTSKHVTVKIADSVANLGAATAIKASRIKLDFERPSNTFNPLGTDVTPDFDRGEATYSGEMVIRYTDTQYETDFLANTIKAMSVTIANGTKTLAFTGSRVRYRELEKSTDKGGVVTQTLSLKFEHDLSLGRSVQAVLNNAKAAYTS